MARFCSRACSSNDRRMYTSFVGSELSFKIGENGCHIFTGPKDKNQYGRVRINGVQLGAHRVSYEAAHGAIPHGKLILHTCDNPPCINPEHLTVGTQSQNMRDMVSRGRIKDRRGEGCGRAKLTESDVIKIRQAGSASGLAELYQVSKGHIYSIRTGKTWGHLPINQNKELEMLR